MAQKVKQVVKQVACPHCNQPITSEVALANELKRIAQQNKEKQEADALEAAATQAVATIRKAVKEINSKHGPVQVQLEEWCEGESAKDPIEYIQFRFTVLGVQDEEEVSLKTALAVLKKLGATL